MFRVRTFPYRDISSFIPLTNAFWRLDLKQIRHGKLIMDIEVILIQVLDKRAQAAKRHKREVHLQ